MRRRLRGLRRCRGRERRRAVRGPPLAGREHPACVRGAVGVAHAQLGGAAVLVLATGAAFAAVTPLTPTEIKSRYPFIELHGLEGGQWDPLDGDIDPAQLTYTRNQQEVSLIDKQPARIVTEILA